MVKKPVGGLGKKHQPPPPRKQHPLQLSQEVVRRHPSPSVKSSKQRGLTTVRARKGQKLTTATTKEPAPLPLEFQKSC